jgi:hypothetical protein
MQIIVFSKTRPTALDEHVTITIVVYFYFIWRTITRHLSQNSLPKLSAIHDFRQFEREALMCTTLGTSKHEKGKQSPSGWLWRIRLRQTYIQMLVDVGWFSRNLDLVLTAKWAAIATFGWS